MLRLVKERCNDIERQNMNKEVTHRKIVKIANRTHIQNLGKYLDIVKNKWFNKIKDM
jgi:hypothetical protein